MNVKDLLRKLSGNEFKCWAFMQLFCAETKISPMLLSKGITVSYTSALKSLRILAMLDLVKEVARRDRFKDLDSQWIITGSKIALKGPSDEKKAPRHMKVAKKKKITSESKESAKLEI